MCVCGRCVKTVWESTDPFCSYIYMCGFPRLHIVLRVLSSLLNFAFFLQPLSLSYCSLLVFFSPHSQLQNTKNPFKPFFFSSLVFLLLLDMRGSFLQVKHADIEITEKQEKSSKLGFSWKVLFSSFVGCCGPLFPSAASSSHLKKIDFFFFFSSEVRFWYRGGERDREGGAKHQKTEGFLACLLSLSFSHYKQRFREAAWDIWIWALCLFSLSILFSWTYIAARFLYNHTNTYLSRQVLHIFFGIKK